ncbi:hypothetical protein G3480_13460 [Thiorhodococcus mannitoliphagus]|uniref:Uncharacterized protein n=1 Tax=Thiorhodococcus mannitoliphagus TaxID=329406 RepID=A0A6P1DT67_9GAMM|nr:hypothetical protein [Thiorhodococcus mannitoliphagus]NEX21308.1 hypothetical protein [Thiorhodococcus mannitoliphagus]
MNPDFTPSQPRSVGRLGVTLVCLLVSGCGDQVVVEGVDLDNGSVVGDSVLDTRINETGMPGDEAYATGDPYEEAVEGEKNLGPNAPGYIP